MYIYFQCSQALRAEFNGVAATPSNIN